MQDKDDISDWYREAAMMDRVYIHTACNISATDAKDGSQGLFRHRHPHSIREATVNLCVDGISHHASHIDCVVIDPDLSRHHISESYTGERGWILQERVLAPRVLRFASHQLFWECRELQACESYPTDFSDDNVVDRFKAYFDFGSVARPEAIYNLTAPVAYWCELVAVYTKMSLTNPGDRLVALSGIAKQYATVYGDTYLAGIWRNNLTYEILWCANTRNDDYDQKYTSLCPAYQAPTWSWASLDISVSYERQEQRGTVFFQVHNVCLDHATSNITGAVTGGWLELIVRLRPAYMIPKRPSFSKDKHLWVHWDTGSSSYGHIETRKILLNNDEVLKTLLCFPTRFVTHMDNGRDLGLMILRSV